MNPDRLLNQLADLINQVECAHPLRVAIDGIDAAGKTTLADELVQPVEKRGRRVIRASLDGFHRPRVEHYRRGMDSAVGYYLDSVDYPALRDILLSPLGPDGDRYYRTAVFDFRIDEPVNEPIRVAHGGAVLLFDGVFLLRPELTPYWDFRIFVEVNFETAVRRAIPRDIDLFGSREAVRVRYQGRYVPAQSNYQEKVQPRSLADVVVVNNDPSKPAFSLLPRQRS